MVPALKNRPYRVGKWLLTAFRFVISWTYCLLAIGAFAAIPNDLRQFSLRFWSIVAACYSIITPLIFVGTWWSMLRNSPSHRRWLTAASLLNFVAIFPIMLRHNSPRFLWMLVVIGIVGLMYCVLINRLQTVPDHFPSMQESPSEL